MPAIVPKSAIQEILQGGIHDIVARTADPVVTADPYKLAFFASAAALDSDTTAYQTANEVTGTGYTAGGAAVTLKVEAVTVGGKAGYGISFDPVTFTGNPVAFTYRYAMIYRDTGTVKRALAIFDHVTDQQASGNTYIYSPSTVANMLPAMFTPA